MYTLGNPRPGIYIPTNVYSSICLIFIKSLPNLIPAKLRPLESRIFCLPGKCNIDPFQKNMIQIHSWCSEKIFWVFFLWYWWKSVYDFCMIIWIPLKCYKKYPRLRIKPVYSGLVYLTCLSIIVYSKQVSLCAKSIPSIP